MESQKLVYILKKSVYNENEVKVIWHMPLLTCTHHEQCVEPRMFGNGETGPWPIYKKTSHFEPI